MTAKEIRDTFLNYFKGETHEVVPSAPLVIKDDPTLLFTNAGMNQFKNIFLNNDNAKFSRVANSQKCLRVSGKHNDLEEVGVDTYHHTMFEMLGNWSFGDYFKEKAIDMAWDLLTNVYKLPKDRLYVTVFEGDKQDGLAWDQEAYGFWSKHIDEGRIIKANKKDNFWEMGEVGPCGPSSEIHIDLRDESEIAKISGLELVNKDHPLVVEIWNLVFIEYNRKADKTLESLPQKHVDTGMGLERLCMALQDKKSNYDTDLFQPMIEKLSQIVGLPYEKSDSKKDIAFRVIVDHIRAVAFSIADSQLPSNNGAGYVIRRILRRAIRYGYSFLKQDKAFMFQLIPVLDEIMGDHFSELRKEKELITKVIKEEEDNFLRTLERGIQKIEQHQGNEINGQFAFELYDTFGFPIDLTRLIAQEKNWSIDEEGFKKKLIEQKERSKNAAKMDVQDWVVLMDDEVEEFVGYDLMETSVKIVKYREVKVKDKTRYQLVFNLTPFYAESGGQVGDSGSIVSNKERIEVVDTKKENNLIIHITEKLPDHLNDAFEAKVDVERRSLIMSNHSATHLLHEALRDILGDHVAQKGSLVHPNYLRFDFSHFQKVSDEELKQIEDFVNRKIRAAIPLEENRSVPLEKAKEMGAMALFGEKYDDVVRVIKFDESIELCGGTHVSNTMNIGTFKIVSESSVASGVRRIEAISSEKADEYLNDQLTLLSELREMLKNPKDVKASLKQLIQQNAQNIKEIESLKREKAGQLKDSLQQEFVEMNGARLLAKRVELDANGMKDLAFQLKSQHDDLLLVLGAASNGKALLSVMVSEGLVKERGLNASDIVRTLAKEIQGGGGGQPFFATAGGKNIDGIDQAIAKAADFLK